jgi:hypothetical protein
MQSHSISALGIRNLWTLWLFRFKLWFVGKRLRGGSSVSTPTQHREDREWREAVLRRLNRAVERFHEEVGRIMRGTPPVGRVERVLFGHTLSLRAKTAAILDVLLKTDDWVEPKKLLEALRYETPGAHSRGALRSAVCRLRDELQASGLDRKVIQSNGRKGEAYRLRLAKRLDRG